MQFFKVSSSRVSNYKIFCGKITNQDFPVIPLTPYCNLLKEHSAEGSQWVLYEANSFKKDAGKIPKINWQVKIFSVKRKKWVIPVSCLELRMSVKTKVPPSSYQVHLERTESKWRAFSAQNFNLSIFSRWEIWYPKFSDKIDCQSVAVFPKIFQEILLVRFCF